MTKVFCDGCGQQITERNECTGGHVSTSRLGAVVVGKRAKLKVELLISKDGTANDGDFCKYCVIETFNQLDDRPKAAEPPAQDER